MDTRWGILKGSLVAAALAGALGVSALSAQEKPSGETTAKEPAASGQQATETPATESKAASQKSEPATASGQKELDLPKEEERAVVPEPADPVKQAAYKALEKHCARCHQDGKLNRRKPAKNFGNVLKLDEIAADPHLVQPGNPDGSRLFIQIVNQEMPYDVYQEFSGGEEPNKEEIQAIRDWITSLGKTVVASCKDRKLLDDGAIVSAIAADLNKEQDHRLKGLRYVTLSHMYNGCTSDEHLEAYRQAVVKLLNSLSQNSDVLRLDTIDEAKTIIKFHLDDLKWSEEDWNKILAVYPYAVKPDNNLTSFVETSTGTPLSWVRGDWLAFTAARPPLYHQLLKQPTTLGKLEEALGLNIEDNIKKFRVHRAGFQDSGVSKNNRLIERHTISTGVFWTSYDFAGNKESQSLYAHPLGPKGDKPFVHDGGETIYSLPNGFNAYYLNTAEGKQLNTGPTTIVQDESQRDLQVTNGISCLGCHNQGFIKKTDKIRNHVLADKTFDKKIRDQVEALYPPAEEMNRLLDQDVSRFRNALRQAGIDPDLKVDGIEIVNALSKAYEGDVNLRLAAAEYGLKEDALKEAMGAAGGESFRLLRRLEQASVPRDTFEAQFAGLVEKVTDGTAIDMSKFADGKAEVAKVGSKSKESTHDFDLALFSNKSDYALNDLAVFTVKSAEDCHLTLINVDGKGQGTVIFPNKFQQKNLLPKGKELQFPGPDAPFQFRLKDAGTETVIAVCNASGKGADGIKHDFKTRNFTGLGKYSDYITRQIVVEGKSKVEAGKEAKKAGKKEVTPSIIARTAIKFEVK